MLTFEHICSEPDWTAISRELIRAIRGERSQNVLNRRLGMEFNQISRWENGRKQISWSEFAQLCSACRLDLDAALLRAVGFPGAAVDTAGLVRHLLAEHEIGEFAKRVGVSRQSVSRWLAGSTVPRLEEVLRAIHKVPATLFVLLEPLVNPRLLPSLASFYEAYISTVDWERRLPEAGAILRCFDLDTYRELGSHQEGFVSRTLGISLEEEREWLRLFERIGALVRHPNGSFRPAARHTDTRGDFVLSKKLRLFWMDRAREVLVRKVEHSPAEDAFGYLIYCVSKETKAEINKRYFEFYNSIRHLVAAGTGHADEIQVMNIQFFRPCGLADPVGDPPCGE